MVNMLSLGGIFFSISVDFFGAHIVQQGAIVSKRRWIGFAVEHDIFTARMNEVVAVAFIFSVLCISISF